MEQENNIYKSITLFNNRMKSYIKNLYLQPIIGCFCLKQATTSLTLGLNIMMTIQPNFALLCIVSFLSSQFKSGHTLG